MGTPKFIKTKTLGVFYYESAERTIGKRPERCFYFLYKDDRRRVHREKVGWESEGVTEKFASNKRQDRLHELRHGGGEPGKPLDPTVGELWNAWLEWAEHNRKGCANDVCRYQLHIAPELGKVAMSDLTRQRLERFKAKLFASQMAPQTVKHVLGLLRGVIFKGIEFDLWRGSNPLSIRKWMPVVENERERFMTKREAGALLEALCMSSEQTHDLALLSLQTGMRASEVMALTWERVDLSTMAVTIFAEQAAGKTRKSRKRVARITPDLQRMFERRLNTNGGGRGLVFRSRDGGQMIQVSDTFERGVAMIGLNKDVENRLHRVTFHTLRHTFASWMAMSERVTLHQLMELMGHRTIFMTQRYAHLIPGHASEAAGAVFG